MKIDTKENSTLTLQKIFKIGTDKDVSEKSYRALLKPRRTDMQANMESNFAYGKWLLVSFFIYHLKH